MISKLGRVIFSTSILKSKISIVFKRFKPLRPSNEPFEIFRWLSKRTISEKS